MSLLLVFTGAGVGGVLRYAIGALVNRFSRGRFPWSTFFINVTGCFVMGVLMSSLEERGAPGDRARLFGAVGILGGYTTFSSFGFEAESLIGDRKLKTGVAYAAASVVAGGIAVLAGRTLARAFGG